MSNFLNIIFCNVSTRGRLKLTGEDRVRFLNGQVTNDIKILTKGSGCYAALTNAKGKMRSDTVILNTGDALFLDLESLYDVHVASELEKFVIADDVIIENLTDSWCAYTAVGEKATQLLQNAGFCDTPPTKLYQISSFPTNLQLGNGFLFRSRRALSDSFDFWIEKAYSTKLVDRLLPPLENLGGKIHDPSILEILRVEAGIPRFGAEMDENTLPPEGGIEAMAISYTKGCYVGQEVIARIKSVGHINRTLIRLCLPSEAKQGNPLTFNGKEVGKLGSAITSLKFGRIGLAIVRREASSPNTILSLPQGEAKVVEDFGLKV